MLQKLVRFVAFATACGLVAAFVLQGGLNDFMPTRTWADSINGGAIFFLAILDIVVEAIVFAMQREQDNIEPDDGFEVVAYGGDSRTRLVLKK